MAKIKQMDCISYGRRLRTLGSRKKFSPTLEPTAASNDHLSIKNEMVLATTTKVTYIPDRRRNRELNSHTTNDSMIILSLIDKESVINIKDISSALNISSEHVIELVKCLLEKGYIYNAKDSWFRQFKKSPKTIQLSKESSFTPTIKGFFSLHHLIASRKNVKKDDF